MDKNEDDMAARVERLEDQVHNLKQLVRRLNRKLALETQPVGLAKMRGFEPVMEPEAVEELRLELEEEQELDLEDEFEVETVEEVSFERDLMDDTDECTTDKIAELTTRLEQLEESFYNSTSVRITGQQIIGDIKSVASELGRTPSYREYNDFGNYSTKTAENRFGSWNEAVEAAGLEPNKSEPPSRKIEDDQLLDDIQRVIEILGYPPLAKKYDDYGEYSTQTIRSRWGSWASALEELGYDMEPGSRHPNEILADVRKVDETVDGRLTAQDYEKHGNFTVQTVRQKWGSWSTALQELGYKVTENGVDIDKYIGDLIDVAAEVGHPPSHSDYDEYGNFNYRTFMTNFGEHFEELAEEAYQLAQSERGNA